MKTNIKIGNLGEGVILLCLLTAGVSAGMLTQLSEAHKREWTEDLAGIRAKGELLEAEQTVDLESYQKYAEGLREKWGQRNKECQAFMVHQLCGAIANRRFTNAYNCNELAREFALSILDEPNGVSVTTQLGLAGLVVTNSPRYAPLTDQEYTRRRRRDLEVRLAVLKRLTDAVDPKWNPNEMLMSPSAVACHVGLPYPIAPENVKDPELRAKYVTVLQEHRETQEEWAKQYELYKWLNRYPKNVEGLAVSAYSNRPYDIGELKACLNESEVEMASRRRILNAVSENMKVKDRLMR